MLVFAVLSEVPFNLMCGGTWFYPVHQNVIWTLLMGLWGASSGNGAPKAKTCPVCGGRSRRYSGGGGAGDSLHGRLLRCRRADGAGFLLFRGRVWWCLAGQLLALYWLNVEMLGGLMYPVQLFGVSFEICQQGLCAACPRADLALPRAAGTPQQGVPVCLLCVLPRAYAGACTGSAVPEPLTPQ